MRIAFILGLASGLTAYTVAQAGTKEICRKRIMYHEKQNGIEPGLMQAIVHVESRMSPYSVNVAGRGYVFLSVNEAVRFVEEKQREGYRNISVGLAQLHVPSHRHRFKSLEHMFDPEANIAYATSYLKLLKRQTGSIDKAVRRYNTPNYELGERYRTRVFGAWAKIRLRHENWFNHSPVMKNASFKQILSKDNAALRLASLQHNLKRLPAQEKKTLFKREKTRNSKLNMATSLELCSDLSCTTIKSYENHRFTEVKKLSELLNIQPPTKAPTV